MAGVSVQSTGLYDSEMIVSHRFPVSIIANANQRGNGAVGIDCR